MPFSKQDAEDIFHKSNEALIRHFEQRAVAIVTWDTDSDAPPKALGSGTCISVGDRYFVATAAHVLEGCRNDQIFLMPGSKEPLPKQWIPIIGRGERGGGSNDPVDIAWLEVDPHAISALQKVFCPLSRLLSGVFHVPDDWIFFIGYPIAQVPQELFKERKLRVQPVGYYTETLPVKRWPQAKKGDPSIDIYIDYNQHALLDKMPFKMIHPEGMSGGGIWLANLIPNKGMWSPDQAQLLGIEHASDDGLSYARGTQIQHWLRMLKEDVPSLGGVIDKQFPKL